MRGFDRPQADPVDLSLLPQLSWNLRWRDPVASQARLKEFIQKHDTPDIEARLLALNGLAWHARNNGDFGAALDLAREAARLSGETGNPHGLVCAQMTRAAAHIDRGELEPSQECLTRSLLYSTGYSRARRSDYQLLRARLHWYAGEYQRAEEQMGLAVRDATDQQLAVAHHDHAWLCLMKRDHDGLKAHVGQAADIATDLQMQAIMPQILGLRAVCARHDGRIDEALDLLDRAEVLATRQGNRRAMCVILMQRGACRAETEAEDAGIADSRAALDLARDLGYRLLAPLIATQLGDVLAAARRYEDATAAFRQALSLRSLKGRYTER